MPRFYMHLTGLRDCFLVFDVSCISAVILSDVLFSLFDINNIADDSVFYACPDRLRLPLIFYYGHTASVYVNKLVLSGLIRVSSL
jgi:hypothetical protein